MLKYINFALSFWLLSSLVGYFRKSAKREESMLHARPGVHHAPRRIFAILRAPQAVR